MSELSDRINDFISKSRLEDVKAFRQKAQRKIRGKAYFGHQPSEKDMQRVGAAWREEMKLKHPKIQKEDIKPSETLQSLARNVGSAISNKEMKKPFDYTKIKNKPIEKGMAGGKWNIHGMVLILKIGHIGVNCLQN